MKKATPSKISVTDRNMTTVRTTPRGLYVRHGPRLYHMRSRTRGRFATILMWTKMSAHSGFRALRVPSPRRRTICTCKPREWTGTVLSTARAAVICGADRSQRGRPEPISEIPDRPRNATGMAPVERIRFSLQTKRHRQRPGIA